MGWCSCSCHAHRKTMACRLLRRTADLRVEWAFVYWPLPCNFCATSAIPLVQCYVLHMHEQAELNVSRGSAGGPATFIKFSKNHILFAREQVQWILQQGKLPPLLAQAATAAYDQALIAEGLDVSRQMLSYDSPLRVPFTSRSSCPLLHDRCFIEIAACP